MKMNCVVRVSFVVIALVGAACSSSSSGGTMNMDGGGGSQKLPIGSPCTMDSDCGGTGFMCMTDHPGGYCVKMCDLSNHDADCPSGSICQFDGMSGECHKECATNADCRTGYFCAPASTDPNDTASHAFCDVGAPADGGSPESSMGDGGAG